MEVIATDVRERLDSALMSEGEARDEKMRSLYEDVCSPIDECALSAMDSESKQCTTYYQVPPLTTLPPLIQKGIQ